MTWTFGCCGISPLALQSGSTATTCLNTELRLSDQSPAFAPMSAAISSDGSREIASSTGELSHGSVMVNVLTTRTPRLEPQGDATTSAGFHRRSASLSRT